MHQRHIRSLYKQIMRPLHNLMSFLVNDMYKGSSSSFFFVTLMKCDKPLSLISFTYEKLMNKCRQNISLILWWLSKKCMFWDHVCSVLNFGQLAPGVPPSPFHIASKNCQLFLATGAWFCNKCFIAQYQRFKSSPYPYLISFTKDMTYVFVYYIYKYN